MKVTDNDLSLFNKFWNKKIRLPYTILLVGLCFSLLAFRGTDIFKWCQSSATPVVVQTNDCPPPPVVRYRMNEYKYTHPLLLADGLTESQSLLDLKNDVMQLINQEKSLGHIEDASVYIRNLNGHEWISINPSEEYHPGSLIKLPLMMTYLFESELNPAILNKQLRLDPSQGVPLQTFNSGNIVAGKSYTVKELFYYMIVKSDNYATLLLNQNVNMNTFKELFLDLGIPEPDLHNPDLAMTASDYSKFMRVLYNASYISNANAEYALSLLAQSTFNEGLVKQLPPDIKVARKFGEWASHKDPNNHQLHESGIVYFENTPYLITALTRGRSADPLANVISSISKLVYDKVAVKRPAL